MAPGAGFEPTVSFRFRINSAVPATNSAIQELKDDRRGIAPPRLPDPKSGGSANSPLTTGRKVMKPGVWYGLVGPPGFFANGGWTAPKWWTRRWVAHRVLVSILWLDV